MQADDWRKHEQILLDFEADWDRNSTPDIDRYLDLHDVDRDYLIDELVRIDLERRWSRGESVRSEYYFERFPQRFSSDERQVALLRHEFHVRARHDCAPSHEEIKGRFPSGEDRIQRILHGEETIADSPPDRIKRGYVPSVGDRVGRYILEEQIGSGTYSNVFRCLDEQLGRAVAIKFLRPYMTSAADRERLRREAKAAASLEHKNILPIIEFGEIEDSDYLVSKFINGPTLEQEMNDRPIRTDRAVSYAVAIASALSVAHRQGVVHRDIKPANILISHGEPLVMDFGMAHLADASVQLTGEGDVIGTPAYMPPEQASGRGWQADPRSDIYSLGVVLYHMLCGHLPFSGSVAETIHKVVHDQPPPPRRFDATIDRDLQTIVLKCLEKEPHDRYQTGDELADDLHRYQHGKPIVARPAGPVRKLWKWSKRRPAVATLLVLVMLASGFLIGSGSQVFRFRRERDRAIDAEARTNRLLAESEADAGLLAMQRGRLGEAIKHYDRALQLGCQDLTEVRFQKLTALVATRRIEAANSVLTQLVHEAVGDEGAINLWRAQLALEPNSDGGDPVALFHAALESDLPPAEQAYARAMISDRSLESVARLREAVSYDPFHHRARRMLIILLLSLAEVDAAAEEAQVARQLYPEDTDFRLLSALIHSARANHDAAMELIEDAELSASHRSGWMAFCDSLRFVTQEMSPEPDSNSFSRDFLRQLGQRYLREFGPLVASRGWHFPPRVGAAFKNLPTRLADLPPRNTDIDEFNHKKLLADELDLILEQHPEGTLFALLGDLRIANDQLVEAHDAFSRALKYPSLVSDPERYLQKGRLTSALILAFARGVDVERYTSEFVDAARKLSPEFVTRASGCRGIVIGLIGATEWDLAAVWSDRWLELSDRSRDALWHRAVVAENQHDWLRTLALCDEMLANRSDDEEALHFRAAVIRRIEQTIQPPPVGPAVPDGPEKN